MINKEYFSKTVTIMLGILVVLVSAASVMSCKDDDVDNNPQNSTPYTISGNGNGSQVVPSAGGSGTGTLSGTYTPSSRQLVYTANWNGLTDVPTAGGFYNASAGMNGLAVSTPWAFSGGSAELGSTSGTVTLTEAQAQDLISGNWYYTYGTATYPGGEVRGQITASR
jgi:CHRD domain